MSRIISLQLVGCLLLLVLASAFGFSEDEEYGLAAPGIDQKLEKLQVYFETEMYEEAASVLNELIVQYPNEPKFTYLKAIVDYERQDYDSSRQIFLEFLEQYPQVAEPYYLLAEISLKKNELDSAKQYLRRYCELVPQDSDAQEKLNALSENVDSVGVIIMKDGREDSALVKKVGFYGGCVHAYEAESVKLINGRHCNWSSMGIDFVYPLDLRGKKILLKLRGKQGGEKLELIFRDRLAQDYAPQLIVTPEQNEVSSHWQDLRISFAGNEPNIDLSQVVHLGLEFGFSTVQNPANSTLFVKDIIIEDARN